MMLLESQDLNELVGLLKDAEESLAALNNGDSEKQMEKSRQSLVSFHTTAAMLGLEGLQKAGLEFEEFLTGKVSPGNTDSLAALGFAISSVAEQMRTSNSGKGSSEIDLDEILEILRPETAACTPAENELRLEPAAGAGDARDELFEADIDSLDAGSSGPDLTNISELVRSWGGELSVTSSEEPGAQFSLTFSASADSLKKIERLLSGDPADPVSHKSADDVAIESLIAKGREFANAFSSGDMVGAQTILLKLADQQNENSGLYKEIGGLARGLHDSIRGFISTLDPSLNEIVKDKIPDSGNRLEHILEMTEKSAITTLDHVETIQERLLTEMEHISSVRGLLGGLNAVGDSAAKKLEHAAQALDSIETIIGQHRSDLDVILGAQDYQDLSGQIILKITQLLKDIEGKLVNLIRTFGVKAETGKQKTSPESSELYGPAHAAVENALHSQDEVDSLLADFGF